MQQYVKDKSCPLLNYEKISRLITFSATVAYRWNIRHEGGARRMIRENRSLYVCRNRGHCPYSRSPWSVLKLSPLMSMVNR
jgi:hypothetical protein